MTVSIKSRAARSLRGLARYVPSEEGVLRELPGYLGEMGEIIGVYENSKSEDGVIVICEDGILISSETSVFVPFHRMSNVIYDEVGEVIGLELRDSGNYFFRVSGGDRRLLAATEFVRFLDRVIEGLSRERSEQLPRIGDNSE